MLQKDQKPVKLHDGATAHLQVAQAPVEVKEAEPKKTTKKRRQ